MYYYPHTLEFYKILHCDICNEIKNKNMIVINLPQNKYFGWNSCGKENCNNQINESIKSIIINNQTLKEMFGDIINVLRSSGTFEKWKIYGDAYKTNSSSDFWIDVKSLNNKKNKCVTLTNLKLWNTLT